MTTGKSLSSTHSTVPILKKASSKIFFSSSVAFESLSSANTPSPTSAGVFGIILRILCSPIYDLITSLSSPATIDTTSLPSRYFEIFSKSDFACIGFTATSTASQDFTNSSSSLYTKKPSSFAFSLDFEYVSKIPISLISIAFLFTKPFAMDEPIFPKPITPNFINTPILKSYP